MKYLVVFSLLFMFMRSFAKETDTLIVLASCKKIEGTGKRHQSFFFTFRIEKFLEGKSSLREFVSQELYSDFGGKQLRAKLHDGAQQKLEKVILKLVKRDSIWHILWACESFRLESFRTMEQTVEDISASIERGDFQQFSALLKDTLVCSEATFQRICQYHKTRDFDVREFFYSELIQEQNGQLWLGGGAFPYNLRLEYSLKSPDWYLTEATHQ